MKKVIVIGSGISGLSCAIQIAELGDTAILVSPYASERSQSVMAAGGINAALGKEDSPKIHMEDTKKGGCYIGGEQAIEGLCRSAPEVVRWLEKIGVVFSRDEEGEIAQRAFGGQTKNRTAFSGAATGKQIVSALVRKARQYEGEGKIIRKYGTDFLCGLISDGICYGAVLYEEMKQKVFAEYADALVLATGGQNKLMGKTTGSTLCDGSAVSSVFLQGAWLKNLEFIQYHPTTVETPHKRMLISEAARGEGGRLFYLNGEKKVYFMEEKYGTRGNLMPRDIVSAEIYRVKKPVYLDITFLGKDKILHKLQEIYDLCEKYAKIDVSKEPIPVYPSVHFFMGGLWVDKNHRTNISNLYAIGECASLYHGANRLGGNSLLAAVYSGKVAAKDINEKNSTKKPKKNFDSFIKEQERKMSEISQSESKFPSHYILKEIQNIMVSSLGIVRNEKELKKGLNEIIYYQDILKKIKFDPRISPYDNYRMESFAALARAVLICALNRKESRGAHLREDFPEKDENLQKASVIEYQNGKFVHRFESEE